MPTYSADQIIGKTLFANKVIAIYLQPYDSAQPSRYVQPGKAVGVVTNYLQPSSYRTDFYWVFQDAVGTEYYVRHHEGDFDIEDLQAQGAMTDAEIAAAAAAEQEKANDPIAYYIKKFLPWVAGIAIGGIIIREGIKKL